MLLDDIQRKYLDAKKEYTVTIEWDSKRETYKCNSFLMVMVDKHATSATFIFDMDPSRPVVCCF